MTATGVGDLVLHPATGAVGRLLRVYAPGELRTQLAEPRDVFDPASGTFRTERDAPNVRPVAELDTGDRLVLSGDEREALVSLSEPEAKLYEALVASLLPAVSSACVAAGLPHLPAARIRSLVTAALAEASRRATSARTGSDPR